MPLRLVLIRHAETEWNRERRYQGWQDTPLSAIGRAQAEVGGRLLATRRSRRSGRARSGARGRPRGHHRERDGLHVRKDDAFSEMGFGEWEGLTRDEVARVPRPAPRLGRDAPAEARGPEAETLAMVRARALAGLEALREAHPERTVCLVSHGITGRVLILEALGLGLDRLWSLQLASTGISELEFRDDWTTLHRMNSLVHLTDVAIA